MCTRLLKDLGPVRTRCFKIYEQNKPYEFVFVSGKEKYPKSYCRSGDPRSNEKLIVRSTSFEEATRTRERILNRDHCIECDDQILKCLNRREYY